MIFINTSATCLSIRTSYKSPEQSAVSITFAKMKAFVFMGLFCLISIISSITESCIVVNQCTGIAQATCTAPCFQCGNCKQFCCSKYLVLIYMLRGPNHLLGTSLMKYLNKNSRKCIFRSE